MKIDFRRVIIFSFLFYLISLYFVSSESPIKEITYNEFRGLENSSKIEVVNNYAIIHTYNSTMNQTQPEFYYYIGNDKLFNNIILNQTYGNRIVPDIKYRSPKRRSPLISILSNLPYYLYIFFMIKLLYMQTSKLSDNKFQKGLELASTIKVQFKDVAGLKEIKEEVREFVDLLRQTDKYKKMNCKTPKGALFYGPPGNGKTLMAKAIAGECNTNFLHVSGANFNEIFVGVGQSRVKKIFATARKNRPCIIFIDEIDSLGRKRGARFSGHSENENTLNSLLYEMDGLTDNNDILVFGATNRPEMLDDALTRPGRFDRKIQFNLPTEIERKEILELYLKKYPVQGNVEKISERIGKSTFGMSGAELSNVCNESAIICVRDKKKKITLKHIQDAIDYVVVGSKRKSMKLNDRDKQVVAHHESGHAFLSYIQKLVESPCKVSIVPTSKGALGFSMSFSNEDYLKTKKQLFQEMAVVIGGRCSEKIYFDDITTGASNDLMKLRAIAKQYVTKYGFSDGLRNNYIDENMERVSNETNKKIDVEIQKLINEVEKYTLDIITGNKHLVSRLANNLLKNEDITYEDMKRLLSKKVENSIN